MGLSANDGGALASFPKGWNGIDSMPGKSPTIDVLQMDIVRSLTQIHRAGGAVMPV